MKTINSNFFKILLQVFTLLIVYLILHLAFNFVLNGLDHSIYENSSSFFFSALLDIRFGTLFFGIFAFLLLNYKKVSWDKFEDKNILRIFILIVAFPLFWEHAFSDYNYYLDTDNNIDRILIFVALLLVYIHPIFAFVVLIIGYLMWNFISFPLGGSHWIDVRVAYEILTLFVAYLLLKSIKKFHDIPIGIFILLALTQHASNYFIPGIAKIEISPHGWEWMFLDNAHNLFVTSYINGWLGFLEEKTILDVAYYLDHMDFLLTIPTLFLQAFAIFLLINKRVTIGFFLVFEVLHFGVILAGGIVFWTWIVVNMGFLYMIKNVSKETLAFLYNKKTILLFMAIVALSPILYKPPVLAWWDSAAHATYDIYITTADKKRSKLNTLDLSPYNTIFSQSNFSYLSEELSLHQYNYGFIIRDMHLYANSSLLLSNFLCDGCKKEKIDFYKNDSYKVYEALQEAENIDEIRAVIAKYGKSFYDKEKKEVLRHFIYTYFTNFNKRGESEPLYKKLGAPYHQYDFSGTRLKGGEKIEKVEFVRSYVWYNKKKRKIVHFDEKTVMVVDIK